MKKLIPLVASLLLLAACGGNGGSAAPTPSSEPTVSSAPAQESSEATQSVTHYLPFLDDGEIYVDINFDKAPEGLSVKVGETTFTSSGKTKMTQNFTYAVTGTFTEKMNIYYLIDAGGPLGGGAKEGYDADGVKEIIEKYLKNFSEKQYEYRVYLCLSDKANGWSKTLEGVDQGLKGFTGK